jgi:arginine deiminase
MHLDTVFTMVDTDKFTVHPNIREELRLFVMEPGGQGHLTITEEHGRLEEVLREHLDLDKVTLIPCGGDSPIDAAREQWNDGSNTFAVAPGKVIVYNRNYVTNRLLEDHGIQTLTIPSSELARGRGGPRCMTMPLIRASV